MRISPRVMLGLMLLSGCGEDEDAPPPPKNRSAVAASSPTAVPKPGATGMLTTFKKIEEVVSERERPDIRHLFRERDFAADPTGTENRDPFRSFVITQVGVGVTEPTIQVEATDVCPIKKQVARTFSVRDLRLIGIVSKGTDRYALFSDTRGEGHIVHRGDCLGQEKSRVKEIGAGFVTLELSPEPIPNQPPRPPEERSIPLYPKELPVGDEFGDEARPRTAPPTDSEGNGAPSPSTRRGPSVPPESTNRQ